MSQIIVDASVVAKWVLPGIHEPLADEASQLLVQYVDHNAKRFGGKFRGPTRGCRMRIGLNFFANLIKPGGVLIQIVVKRNSFSYGLICILLNWLKR